MNNKELAAWLDRHPNPEDEQVHALARARGLEKDELEDRIYRLATVGAKFKNNGDWNKKGRPAVDPKIVEEGAEIEMEHTDDKATARRIAMDHTAGPGKKNYYRNPEVAAADLRKEMKKKAALNAVYDTAFAEELQKLSI